MTGGEISENITAGGGGGIVVDLDVVMNFSGGSILNNKAINTIVGTSGGGGIASAQGSTIKMTGGTIKGNSAIYGGGINNGGKLTITAGSVTGNMATKLGGGVFNSFNRQRQPAVYAQPGGSVSGNAPDNVFNEQQILP